MFDQSIGCPCRVNSHNGILKTWTMTTLSRIDGGMMAVVSAFLRRLKFEEDNGPTDKLATEQHAEAFRIIDQTWRANRCETINNFFSKVFASSRPASDPS